MKKTKFTPEQITALRQVPYTHNVTDYQIRFTNEFKQEFWKLYIQGQSPESIFKQLGYDPKILGTSRIGNFTYKLTQSKLEADNETDAQKFRKLEGEILALRSELDALKKTILLANSMRRGNS